MQRELALRVADAGWVGVEWRNLSGGIVALHRARAPR
jgi:demethylmenaquinone methyltransferase/2-methoxy-6-polyprenyl-1,4-benzoquinol methylase